MDIWKREISRDKRFKIIRIKVCSSTKPTHGNE